MWMTVCYNSFVELSADPPCNIDTHNSFALNNGLSLPQNTQLVSKEVLFGTDKYTKGTLVVSISENFRQQETVWESWLMLFM